MSTASGSQNVRTASAAFAAARKSNAGFSLLEVLAALLISTILMLTFTPFVRLMLGTWPLGSEVTRLVEFRVRGLGVLRSDLRRAVAWRGFGKAEDLLGFRGNETSMSFPVAMNFGDNRDGLEMIAIDVANSRAGRALVRRRAAIVGTSYSVFGDPVVLFSGPYKYVISYYASDGTQRPVWADPAELPTRVVLNISDEYGRFPVASVQLPLLASISSACMVSPNLPRCPVDPEAAINAINIASQTSGFSLPTQ